MNQPPYSLQPRNLCDDHAGGGAPLCLHTLSTPFQLSQQTPTANGGVQDRLPSAAVVFVAHMLPGLKTP